jgi:hypothetical protein
LTYQYLMGVPPSTNSAAVYAGDRTVTYRPLAVPATNGCVYFSFLINFLTEPGDYYLLGLTQSTNAAPGGGADDPLDLIDGEPSTNVYNLGVRAMGGATSWMDYAFLLNTNVTYFVVMKYNFTNGSASLFVNPPAGNTEPSPPDVVSLATNNTPVPDLSYVYLRVGSSIAGSFVVSGLRVASTWEEVTPATNATTAYNQAAMLTAYLDSLQVDDYWLIGTNVNWLTGAPGNYDDGPNMTEGNATHCSAFAAAAADMLGTYILRQPAASDINLANNQALWLATNTVGWYPAASMAEAQHMANTGDLVVASYLNPDFSVSGHIAVLRPSNRTDTSVDTFGPEECQAGETNYADTNIETGFGAHPGAFPSNINYYYHAVSYPVSPVSPVFSLSSASNGTFTADVLTVVGRTFQAQWSGDLITWMPLLTFTNSNNSTNFYTNTVITDILSGPRFYRLLSP